MGFQLDLNALTEVVSNPRTSISYDIRRTGDSNFTIPEAAWLKHGLENRGMKLLSQNGTPVLAILSEDDASFLKRKFTTDGEPMNKGRSFKNLSLATMLNDVHPDVKKFDLVQAAEADGVTYFTLEPTGSASQDEADEADDAESFDEDEDPVEDAPAVNEVTVTPAAESVAEEAPESIFGGF